MPSCSCCASGVEATPIVVDDRGRVVVPDEPGIGVEIDFEALDAATVDLVSLEAS